MRPNEDISATISYLRFPATLYVVILHAYTTARGIYMPTNTWYVHISYILSLCIGQIGVPLFFTISGYLYFIKYNNTFQSYQSKCKKRVKSLLVPYLFWNCFMILLYYTLQNIPTLDSFFSGANKEISNYTIENFIRAFWDCNNWNNGNGMPILQPYWYIRNLIILSLLSPIIYICIQKFKWYTFIIPLIGWIISSDLALIYVSFAFFTLGAIVIIHKIDIIALYNKHHAKIYYAFLIALIITYITHFYTPYDLIPLHRIMLTLGVIFCFCVAYTLKGKYKITNKWQQASFIIYTLHLPIMLAVRKIEYKLVKSPTELDNILLYIIAVITTVLICIAIYNLLKRIPIILNFATGR